VAGRRARLLGNVEWNGIDYVEVEDAGDRKTQWLCVHLLGRVPQGIDARNVRICGGRRIRDLRVTAVEVHRSEDPELDDCLRVRLDRAGDFSTYCLCIGVVVDSRDEDCREPAEGATRWTTLPGFDPRYSCAEFTFGAGCPTPLDCAETSPCDAPETTPPAIDYLAKDYATFRRLLLDRLAVTLPDWSERHVPDVGITLSSCWPMPPTG